MNRSIFSVIRRSRSVAFLGLLLALSAGIAQASTITENFDSDPGWQAAGTTNGYNDFGYSSTNYAGGAAGEAGGAIASRTDGFDWYADNDLGSVYTLKDALTASGKFTVNSVNGFDGGFEIGFFNPNGTGSVIDGGIAEGLVMRLIDQSSTQVRGCLRFGSRSTSVFFLNVGSDYTFDLNWNPTAINLDNGTATLVIKTDGGSEVASVSIDHDNDGWSLANFGITTLNFGAYRNDGANFYMDDVTYTHEVPEPGALALLGMGLVGLLAYAWRKRK